MKVKKLTALLMAAMMTISLAACGNSGTPASEPAADTAAPADGETDGNTADTDTQAGENGDSYEELLAEIIPEETVTLEKFNVKLNIIPDPDGVYETRMESGNLGDIVIWGNDSDEYMQAVQKGMLFDWNEDEILSDYGPYIEEHMPYALEKNTNLSGGTTYGYGFDVAVDPSARGDIMYTWDLRWDLYKELGYPAIKNLDDMVEVLAQMKEICPKDDNGKTTYGVSLFNDWDGDMVMFVKSTATAYYGYDEFGFGLYDSEEQKYYPCLEKDDPEI